MGEGVSPAALHELAEELHKQGVGDEAADEAGQAPRSGKRRGSGRGVGS